MFDNNKKLVNNIERNIRQKVLKRWKKLTIQNTADVEVIKSRIYKVRRLRVMLDCDLTELYEVGVSQLKRQVRRVIDRFRLAENRGKVCFHYAEAMLS